MNENPTTIIIKLIIKILLLSCLQSGEILTNENNITSASTDIASFPLPLLNILADMRKFRYPAHIVSKHEFF